MIAPSTGKGSASGGPPSLLLVVRLLLLLLLLFPCGESTTSSSAASHQDEDPRGEKPHHRRRRARSYPPPRDSRPLASQDPLDPEGVYGGDRGGGGAALAGECSRLAPLGGGRRWLQPANSSSAANATNTTPWWQPKASDRLSWQWNLEGPINANLKVDVFDIDLFDTPASTIRTLQARGVKVICYFSAGSYEWWRPDWHRFFPFVPAGRWYGGPRPPFAGNMSEWDERWLDVRRIRLLRPIMTSRLALAAKKGCDGVEPDIMDAYRHLPEVRKPIAAADQLRYNRFIANTAHSLGLSVGLKNDVDQLPELVQYFDFAVNEQCFQYEECSVYSASFVRQDKAVFGAEYAGDPAAFCPLANRMMLSFQKKRLALGRWRIGCENY